MIKLIITNLCYLFLLALFCIFGCSDSKSQRATLDDSQEDKDLDEYYIEYEEEYEEPTQEKVPVQRFEPCIYCHGSGICAACNGSGGDEWYSTNGDWHFTECVGCHGLRRCYYCGGRGGADIIVYVDAEY